MALTNVFREPRREITESVVGFVITAMIVTGFGWLDYQFAVWYHGIAAGRLDEGLFVGFFLAGLIFIIGGLIIFITHAIGEGICNALARRGLELRPRVRR